MGEARNCDLNFSNFNLTSVPFLHLSSLTSSAVTKPAFAVGINIFIMFLNGWYNVLRQVQVVHLERLIQLFVLSEVCLLCGQQDWISFMNSYSLPRKIFEEAIFEQYVLIYLR